MALYHYFKPVFKKLPDPGGPLSQSIPPLSICDANEAYLKATAQSEASKCSPCIKLTGIQQAIIAKYAFAHGNQKAIRRFTKQYCVEIRETQ